MAPISPFIVLVPPQPQPSNVLPKLGDRLICLETLQLDSNGTALAGTAVLQNLAYEKDLLVFFTFDNWQTTSKIKAQWEANHPVGNEQRWSFLIDLSSDANAIEGKRMSIALEYKAGGKTMLDNNYGQFYIAEFKRQPPPAVKATPMRPEPDIQSIPATIKSNAKAKSWKGPTPLQRNVFKAVRLDKDVIFHGEPGSGKLAAALFPIISHLLDFPDARCLIFCETSIRASAVDREVRTLIQNTPLTSTSLYALPTHQKMAPHNRLWLNMRQGAKTANIVAATLGGIQQHDKAVGALHLETFRTVAFDTFDFSVFGLSQGVAGELAIVLSALSSQAQRLFWTSSADADSPAIAFATSLCRNPKEVSLLGEPSSPAKRQAVMAKIEHHMVRFPAPPHTTPRRLQWLERYLANQTHFKVLVLVSYRDRVTRLQQHLKAAFRFKGRYIRCFAVSPEAYSYGSERFHDTRAVIVTSDAADDCQLQRCTAVVSLDSPHNDTAFFHRAHLAAKVCAQAIRPLYTLVNDQPLDVAGWNFFQKAFALKPIAHDGREYGDFDVDAKSHCTSGRDRMQHRL